MVKTQFGKSIKCLRSENGVIQEFPCVYTPKK